MNILTDICKEVNILNIASKRFLTLVEAIEAEEDKNKKADIALNFLLKNNLPVKIPYPELYSILTNKESYKDIELMRYLYVFERSLPRRVTDTSTWLERLRIFTDTYLLEHSLVGRSFNGKPVLRFTRASGDHEALNAGKGKYGSDFYYWDTKPNFVECKHWSTDDLDAARVFYSDKRYHADHVIVCLNNKQIY